MSSFVSRPSRILAILSLTLTTALWGVSYPLIKEMILIYPPCTLAALRLVFALAVLVPILLLQGRRPRITRTAILLGLSGVAAYQLLQNTGMQHVSAGETVIVLYGATAVLTILLGWCVLGERCSILTGLALVASVAGVTLVAMNPDQRSGLGFPLAGMGLILLSALTWAVYTVIGRRNSGNDLTEINTGALIVGLVVMTPFVMREHPGLDGRTGRHDLLMLATLGAVITAGTYYFWCYSIRHLRASEVGVLSAGEPVFGLFFAWVLLQESISTREIAGVAIVVGSCMLVTLAAPAPSLEAPRALQ